MELLSEYTIIDPADGLEELTGLTAADPNAAPTGPHGKDEEGNDLFWEWTGPKPISFIPKFKLPEDEHFNIWRDEETETIYMDPKTGPHEFTVVYVHGFTSMA